MIPHAQAASAVPHRLGGGPNLLICPASSPSRASYSEDFSAMDPLARLGLSIVLCAVPVAAAEPLEIGSRWELFVDEFLVAEKNGVALKLDEPVRREVVLVTDRPWEGNTSAYFTVIQDGGRVRMYYRGFAGSSDHSDAQVTCVAESADGILFTRPSVGLIEAGGTKDNNVVWRGVESHNFSPLLDANPAARPEQQFKALGGLKRGGLYALASADGIRWKKMQDGPVITEGGFDSQNLAFWDATRDRYVCFSRTLTKNVRTFQSNTSPDFLTWSEGVPHRYAAGVPLEHFYTAATVPCPTAPHLFLSFPKRFVVDRKKVAGHGGAGVSDAVFMSSRDGVNWDRPFLEAWVRPGPDLKNWTDRNTMTANGIVVTGEGEWSLYISEHYRHDDHRIRRLTVRKQGFASMHGGAGGGSFMTKPLVVGGAKLLLNYATSAAGTVKVEAVDDSGKVVASSPELYGDHVESPVLDLSALTGKAVRLRLTLADADLYAIRFGD